MHGIPEEQLDLNGIVNNPGISIALSQERKDVRVSFNVDMRADSNDSLQSMSVQWLHTYKIKFRAVGSCMGGRSTIKDQRSKSKDQRSKTKDYRSKIEP